MSQAFSHPLRFFRSLTRLLLVFLESYTSPEYVVHHFIRYYPSRQELAEEETHWDLGKPKSSVLTLPPCLGQLLVRTLGVNFQVYKVYVWWGEG